jgi:hypothetical protein
MDKSTVKMVMNENGERIDYEAAVNLMDDGPREELHAEGIESDQEFIERYAKMHEERFGEGFAPYTGGEW